jgi:outer membrane protein
MKRTVLIVLLLGTITSVVNAQTEQGRWMVGAQVGNIAYQTRSVSSYFSASISPSAGYFVSDNLLVGTGIPLSLSMSRYDLGSNVETRSISYGLSPFANYFFGNGEIKPYVGIAFGYSRTNDTRKQNYPATVSSKTTQNNSLINIAPTVGAAYFITDNVALNAGLNYNIQSYRGEAIDLSNQPEDYTTNWRSLSLTVGFQLFFGY